MRRYPARFRSTLLFCAAVTACQDMPTGGELEPVRSPLDPRLTRRGGTLSAALNSAEFKCVVRVEDLSMAGGFRNITATLHFSGTAISKNGATRSLQRRARGAGPNSEVRFDCQIPATSEAGELMDRYLASVAARGGRRGRADQGAVTPQSVWGYNPYDCEYEAYEQASMGICYDDPYPDPWNEPPGSGSGGGGGSGSEGGAMEAPPICDSRQPGCLVDLQPAEKNWLETAINSSVKASSEFSDPQVAAVCQRLQARFAEMMAAGSVYRGEEGLPDNMNDPNSSHVAQAWLQPTGEYVMHVDGDVLDRAMAMGGEGWNAVIAGFVLHEAAHALGYTHPGEVGTYNTHPFNHTSGGTGEQCIR
jgi:hypothetical protein